MHLESAKIVWSLEKLLEKTVLFLYWINKILFIGIKDRHYKHMETEHTYHAHCACHCVCFCWCFIASHHPSLLTDDGLSVVTRNVMESHSIPIEVVQDSNTKFISLSVIWLSPSRSEINQYNFNFIVVKATKKQHLSPKFHNFKAKGPGLWARH